MTTTSPPVIIEAAINGGTPKSRNVNVPRTPTEIAADAAACFAAGAAIVHSHIDLATVDGPTAAAQYLAGWRPVLEQRPDAIVYPTIHLDSDMLPAFDHLAPLAESGLVRMCAVDPGSLNFGKMAEGVPVGGFVYRNSFDAIRDVFELCRLLRLGPSLAVYEPGFLRTIVAWWRAGRLPAGAMVKLYFCDSHGYDGAPFGLPPSSRALESYLELLDGCSLPWAVSVVGGDIINSPITPLVLANGGHLHVGLEFYGGEGAPTNVDLVRSASELCTNAGRSVASSSEAAMILGLPRVRVTNES